MTPHQKIINAIRQSLTPDLLTAFYRAQLAPGDPPETGHCAVAAEAFYHLAGGKAAGFMPVVAGFDTTQGRQTHWWVKHVPTGKIYDPTIAQFPDGFDYRLGRHTGFMQPQKKPSKRAQIVIDRVIEKLGADFIAAFQSTCLKKKIKTPVFP